MDKKYQPEKFEEKIYSLWEKGGYFTPKIDKGKKPFTIFLPPPNANDPLHVGHALFVIEDILCRWHRMMGEPTLFLPGTDHAGIETQYVFEKHLREKGQSRFDYDRQALYRMIEKFVEKNRGIAKKQLKRLGYSLDWSRERYTLEPEILKTVFNTFKKLHEDGLIYRGKRIVNYCVFCGTAFSNLEVDYREQDDFLFFIDYGPLVVATTRPETIFADTAIAVNPKDERYRALIGKKATLPLLGKKLPIIADDLVEPSFGTGALKITPGHDAVDFAIGEKHNLEIINVISPEGKMINVIDKYLGLSPLEARRLTIDDLEDAGKLVKVEPLQHSVGVCYRCKNLIEPLAMPQWFVKIEPLAKPAEEAVRRGHLKIFPKRFEKLYLNWLEDIYDWNISRQIVWGPRIPAWYCLDCNSDISLTFIDREKKNISGKYKDLRAKYSFEEIKQGLQSLIAPEKAPYFLEDKKCPACKSANVLQETDTFDTWFSSGQWPLTALGFPDSEDFKYFYPSSVLDTMWDILFFWVVRMVMFGLYRTKQLPFKVAHMHCRVVDKHGKKMSKSRGNVIDPMETVDKYGADVLRLALVFGAAPASDIVLTEDKLIAMRNFANKIWNGSRFIYLSCEKENWEIDFNREKTVEDKKMLEELESLKKKASQYLKKYRFGQAAEEIYQFFWHSYCDAFLEDNKERIKEALPTLIEIMVASLKMVHPFMPFVTEAIYQIFKEKFAQNPLFEAEVLAIAPWPD